MFKDLLTKLMSLFRDKFTLGDRDSQGFRLLYVNNKPSHILVMDFTGNNDEDLLSSAIQIYKRSS